MTGVGYYRQLLAETPRIEAFRRAIVSAVSPGTTVLDVGCGLGTFAFLAADAGASRVWAVDGSPIVHVAKEVSRDNGYESRITFLRGWLPAVPLAEKVDVVVFEDFPARFLDAASFRLLGTVRERYAAPNAVWVPEAAELFLAPVGGAAMQKELDADGGEQRYGLDWSASREYVYQEPQVADLPPAALLASPARIGRVCLGANMTSQDLGGEASFTLSAGGRVVGLAFWFDLELAKDIRLSNAPGATPRSWGHLFLPLEDPPVGRPGDRLRAAVRSHPLPDGAPGWLRWHVHLGEQSRRGDELAGLPTSLDDLVAASPDHTPSLNESGCLALRVLELTDGRRSIREIAEQILDGRPNLSAAEAERFVVEVLREKILRRDTSAPVCGGKRS